jgi:hypothetical protein
MRLLHNVNLTKAKLWLMLQCESGFSTCVLCYVEREREREREMSFTSHMHLSLSTIVYSWFVILSLVVDCWLLIHDYTTHTYLQRPRIDTRDSSRMSRETCTVDENVLEQRSQSTSCILLSLSLSQSSQIVFIFDLWNSNSHSHSHSHIEEKWNESLSQFSVDCCVPWFETHTNWKSFETICAMLQQQWNEMDIICSIAISPLLFFGVNWMCFFLAHLTKEL